MTTLLQTFASGGWSRFPSRRVPRPRDAGRAAAEAAFRRAWPAYASTAALDRLRATEFARLELTHTVVACRIRVRFARALPAASTSP